MTTATKTKIKVDVDAPITEFCPSCQREVEAKDGICTQCGWKFATATGSSTGAAVFAPARAAKIQVVADVAIEVDRTGSSQEFAVGIPIASEMIIKPIVAKVRESRFWCGSHGDLDYDEPHVLLTDKGTADQVLSDIRAIRYAGGGDAEEHHLDGIEQLFRLVPWSSSSDSRGALIAFLTADTKPARSGITAAALGSQLAKKGILFYLVCQETPTLRELADAAKGFLFPISNTPSTTDMQKIAAQIAASITDVRASGGTLPMPS